MSGDQAAHGASRPCSVVPLDGTAHLPPEVLGGKGFGIDVMRAAGLPVPPAFCLYTDDSGTSRGNGSDDVTDSAVRHGIEWLEAQTGRSFGGGPRPLLVSVRSSPVESMPGMLDTVLDVGIDDAVEASLARWWSPGFARETRARLHRGYRRVVGRRTAGSENPEVVPDDPYLQLTRAIEAVRTSGDSASAAAYRAHHGIEAAGGVAVIVQAMVFGNADPRSGSGVVFSRNPVTGDGAPFGEYLPGAQGDVVVSGEAGGDDLDSLRGGHPEVYDELIAAAHILERRFADVQDIEFTVEAGTLWLLQTRTARCSAQATARLALALRDEGIIGDDDVLRRVRPAHVEALTTPSLQPEVRLTAALLATGIPACPGLASGTAYSDVDEAIAAADAGADVVLVRPETSPDDVAAILGARAVVTEIGGAASHAAIVSRELGRPAVVGCGAGAAMVLSGGSITVDGTEGEVRQGILPATGWSEDEHPELRALADIARSVSPLRAHRTGDHPRLRDGSPDAVRAALAAGLTDVVADSPLVVMLRALELSS